MDLAARYEDDTHTLTMYDPVTGEIHCETISGIIVVDQSV